MLLGARGRNNWRVMRDRTIEILAKLTVRLVMLAIFAWLMSWMETIKLIAWMSFFAFAELQDIRQKIINS